MAKITGPISNCPQCGWQWSFYVANTGICPECGNKYETVGYPSFKITWAITVKRIVAIAPQNEQPAPEPEESKPEEKIIIKPKQTTLF